LYNEVISDRENRYIQFSIKSTHINGYICDSTDIFAWKCTSGVIVGNSTYIPEVGRGSRLGLGTRADLKVILF